MNIFKWGQKIVPPSERGRQNPAVTVFGFRDEFIIAPQAYNYLMGRNSVPPFVTVPISDSIERELGEAIINSLGESGHYDPNWILNGPFEFEGLTRYKNRVEFGRHANEIAIDEFPAGTLRIGLFPDTQRRIRGYKQDRDILLSEWPPESLARTVLELEAPFRQVMTETRWAKKRK